MLTTVLDSLSFFVSLMFSGRGVQLACLVYVLAYLILFAVANLQRVPGWTLQVNSSVVNDFSEGRSRSPSVSPTKDGEAKFSGTLNWQKNKMGKKRATISEMQSVSPVGDLPIAHRDLSIAHKAHASS